MVMLIPFQSQVVEEKLKKVLDYHAIFLDEIGLDRLQKLFYLN